MNVVKELVAAANELVAADKMQASDWHETKPSNT